MRKKTIPTPTLGAILKEEFLEPLSISAYRLAKNLHVSTSTILDIVNGKRNLSTEMALRFSRYFGTSEKFWMNLQNDIDIRNKKAEIQRELNRIQPLTKSA